MTPSARLQAAIELLSNVEGSSYPSDGVVQKYFRTRRFIGSKDRKAIGNRVWRLVRHRARLAWQLDEMAPTTRMRVLADCVVNEATDLADLRDLCSGKTYAPPPITDKELTLLVAALSRDLSIAPTHVLVECPDWLWPYFTDLYGDQTEIEIRALSKEAPFDLRVNTIKIDRDTARVALADEGLVSSNTPFSPFGLRLTGRTALGNSKAFTQGLIEIQDEGSQLAALMAETFAEHQVLDLCAGAGGKALALAAAMGGSGRIVACDLHAGRLNKAKLRLKRAGVHSVTTRVLDPKNCNWLNKRRKSFDRVLIDAPCSGTGAWRRQPDARWRLTPGDLDKHIATQNALLAQGGRMVMPGGRLIYVTCSLLRQENEDRISSFLERHEHFRPLSVADIWKRVLGTRYPGRGKYLRLSPRRHHTDGFFVAVLEREK
ncbi:MAG: RsmB/NOP family class I SAM-dependent RNA methyltransferase [Rhodospirillaceae bacterium]